MPPKTNKNKTAKSSTAKSKTTKMEEQEQQNENKKQSKEKTTKAVATEAKKKGILAQLKTFQDVLSGKILDSPFKIQELINNLPYNTGDALCPKLAFEQKKAHCFCGALLAAAALKAINIKPMLIFLNAENDDGHVLCTFTVGNRVGAIAQSNFAGLRYREPVYRDTRELVMSYFTSYFNTARQLTLRSYTDPVDCDKVCKKKDWINDQEQVAVIEDALYEAEEHDLLTKKQIQNLNLVDDRSFESGTLGINLDGAFKPE